MSDAKALAKRFVRCNGRIQPQHTGDQPVKCIALQLFLIGPEALGLKARLQINKCKPTAKRIIQHGKAPVCRIHHTDQVNISWHREFFVCVQQLQRNAALVVLDQHKQLAKNLAQISTVDLVNDEEIIPVCIDFCFFAEIVECTLFQLKACGRRAVSHDKILIGVALVELDHHHTLDVFFSHDRVSQPLCGIGLAHTRSALQDNILLDFQNIDQFFVIFLLHENIL